MDPATLALIGSGIFGGLGALFGGKGKEVEPKPNPMLVPWGSEVLASWLFSPFIFNQEANTWEMRGVPPYPNELSPEVDRTILPNVWNSWKSDNAATDYLQQSLAQGFNITPQMQAAQDTMMNFGAPSQNLAENMWKQAQWGGTGQKGQPAMDMLMQFGAASPIAGQYLSNMAQFGVPSEAGRIVANRAQGFPVGGAQWLQQYAKPADFTPMQRSKK